MRNGLARLVGAVVMMLLIAASGAAWAVDEIKAGPKIGTNIAALISAQDQHGVSQEFKTLAKKRGLVLLFSRSLNW
jgi:hypothetical protein